MSFKKYRNQGKAVEVTVNSKDEEFCLDLVQEFGLCYLNPSHGRYSEQRLATKNTIQTVRLIKVTKVTGKSLLMHFSCGFALLPPKRIHETAPQYIMWGRRGVLQIRSLQKS